MKKPVKRIIEAQRDSVLISDIKINLKKKGDRIDLLSKDSLGRQIISLQKLTKSKDLDSLIEKNEIFLYDENDNLLKQFSPVKSESLNLARNTASSSLKGSSVTYVIGDGLKIDPGSILKLNFNNNGTSTNPSREDHAHGLMMVQEFVNENTVNVNHNFQKYPIVQVIVNDFVLIPESIKHNSINDFTVKFSSKKTGKVIAIQGI